MKDRDGIANRPRLGYHIGKGARRGKNTIPGYVAWLRAVAQLICELCRARRTSGEDGSRRGRVHIVWRGSGVPEELFAAFRGVAALPEELFDEISGLFGCCRVVLGESAGGSLPCYAIGRAEDPAAELTECLRFISAHTGRKIDWDGFMAECERSGRRSERLLRLASALQSGFPRFIDTSSLRSAASGVLEIKDARPSARSERETEI